MKFLIENNMVNENQHGFLKGRNIETSIFGYVNDILNPHENHELALGIFLDLSKAHDTINHKLFVVESNMLKIGG